MKHEKRKEYKDWLESLGYQFEEGVGLNEYVVDHKWIDIVKLIEKRKHFEDKVTEFLRSKKTMLEFDKTSNLAIPPIKTAPPPPKDREFKENGLVEYFTWKLKQRK